MRLELHSTMTEHLLRVFRGLQPGHGEVAGQSRYDRHRQSECRLVKSESTAVVKLRSLRWPCASHID